MKQKLITAALAAVGGMAVWSAFAVAAPHLDGGQAALAEAKNLPPPSVKPGKDGKVKLTDDQWKKLLPPDVYNVTRQAGTEAPFSHPYAEMHDKGTFYCADCGLPLFSSNTKFDSGTGWPSFWAPLSKSAVSDLTDHSLGMARTEVRCSRCGAHLGHVFDDGPKPTGLRYCMNGLALKFIPAGKAATPVAGKAKPAPVKATRG